MLIILYILIAYTIATGLSSIVIPQIIRIACEAKLFDKPEKRKLHTDSIPRLGGLSFVPVFLFSIFFTIAISYIYNPQTILKEELISFLSKSGLIICGLILLYLTGIKDDLVGMKYMNKFIIQFISACLIPLSGLWINNLYGLLGIYELSPFLGIPLTVFMVIFIINAINLIDGIDGLASGLCAIGLALTGGIFLVNGEWLFAMSAFSVLGILVPFFYYNVFGKASRKKKIFMGDTGSLTLGYFLAFFAIHASFVDGKQAVEGNMIMIAFAPLLIPLLDVCRVIYVRFRSGLHIFTADRNHIHHKFLEMGLSPRQTLIFLLSISIILCTANIFLAPIMNPNFLLLADIMAWVIMKRGIGYLASWKIGVKMREYKDRRLMEKGA
jgi:UDP-N-acetylmuramyl pentapeptide phosphotransferase/UDP-N-acetylglucosamine-1-phosphate transferase